MSLPEPPTLGTAMLPAGTFAGEVVLISGGGTGLGKAMAIEFARLGAAHQTARDFLLTLRYLSGNRAVCHREQITPCLAGFFTREREHVPISLGDLDDGPATQGWHHRHGGDRSRRVFIRPLEI